MTASSAPDPFRIDIADDALDDLRRRLRATRFVEPSSTERWAGGVDPDYLRSLVSYWAEEFDWPARQAALNEYPQFTAEVAGRRLHFVHLRAVPGSSSAVRDDPGGSEVAGAGTSAPRPPLILCHGWPSSFVEMLPLAERLADPARFGGDAGDAVDVVVPSMPGFLFSELPDEPLSRQALARPLHELMTGVLGYKTYGAFGGDIGGVASGWMAATHPEAVVGLHMIHPPFPASFDDAPLTVDEQLFLDAEEHYDRTDGGYSAIMITRPDTVGAALIDSPSGLAAWIVDKYRDWSDCGGDVESRWDRDTLCTVFTLYWVTGSIGTSLRQYFDFALSAARPMITIPAAFTLSAEVGMVGFPRSIAERACSDIRSWNLPGRGGHFLAFEEPELMAAELTAFFGSLR
ncbi:epoxide hydrolase family protein [Glaciihabitans sp. dw_435]|uniref:epoxide hydrolase family protein n=1 Tax=Glaciihabitans sp. dw_435 TaxID=2720081 RepID=UPI001BD55577|nr:epoxide hydrolase family protein [Glaciihabitans sp. dw_435]